jgi:hypothetical protein
MSPNRKRAVARVVIWIFAAAASGAAAGEAAWARLG